MKRLFAITMLSLLPLIAAAQDWREQYDTIGTANQYGLCWAKKGKRYGFVNAAGDEIVPCKFSAVGAYNAQGFVWVNKGGHLYAKSSEIAGGYFGVYNQRGEEVIAVKYGAIGTFSPERSTDGNPYCMLDSVIWGEDRSLYKNLISGSGRNSASGNHLFDVKNTSSQFPNSGHAKWIARNAGNFDVHEPMPIDPTMHSMMDLSAGNYFVVSKKPYNASPALNSKGEKIYLSLESRGTNKWGIIDTAGNVILPAGKYDIVYAPTETYVPVAKYKRGKYCINYYNTATEKLAFKKWMQTLAITPVRHGKVVIISATEEEAYFASIVTGEMEGASYYAVFPVRDGQSIIACRSSSYHIINYNGEIKIPGTFNFASSEDYGLIAYRLGNDTHFGFMDTTGHIIAEAQYETYNRFKYRKAMVKKSGAWGCIDTEGKEVVPTRFNSIVLITNPGQNILFCKEEHGGMFYAYRFYSEQRLFETSFSSVRNFGSDYDSIAFVWQKTDDGTEAAGCVTTTGEMPIPCICKDYKEALYLYTQRLRDGFTHWSDADTRRFRITHDPTRNSYYIPASIKKSSIRVKVATMENGKETTIEKTFNRVLPSSVWDY